MAEADTIKPDAKPPVSDSTTGGFEDFLSKQTERNQARGDELMGKVGEVTGRIKQIDKAVDQTKPPELIPMPGRPDIRQNNPMEAFGSAASWLAVFGGFLTKKPLETALNASAGVMNAVRERDYEQAKFSMKEWQVASDNAAAMNRFQVDTYKQALAKLGENRKDAIAELQSYTAAFKDVTGADLLSARMYADFQKHVVALEGMEEKRAKNGPAEYEAYQRAQLFERITGAKTPEEKQVAQEDLAAFNRAFPAHGGAQVTASDNRTKANVAKADKITSAYETWKKNPGNEGKDLEEFIPIWQRLNGIVDPEVKAQLKEKEISARSVAKDGISSAWRTYHEQNPEGSWQDFETSYRELHGTMSPADKKALAEMKMEVPKGEIANAWALYQKTHDAATWDEFEIDYRRLKGKLSPEEQFTLNDNRAAAAKERAQIISGGSGAPGVPKKVAEAAEKSIPGAVETLKRLDNGIAGIIQNPGAIGMRGTLVDGLGGLVQQAEAAFNARGAFTGKQGMDVEGVREVRALLQNTVGSLIPTITGDKSERYSDKDRKIAEDAFNALQGTSSPQQAMISLSIIRDITMRGLIKDLKLSGPSGKAMLDAMGITADQLEQKRFAQLVGKDGEYEYSRVWFQDGDIWAEKPDGTMGRLKWH